MPDKDIEQAYKNPAAQIFDSAINHLDATSLDVSAAILDANPVPCFVIDDQHRVVHWNKACEQVLGVSANSLIGTTEHWRIFYPARRPTLADLIVDRQIDEIANDLYQNNDLRRSLLISGAYEAEAFFAHLGPGGKHLFFTAAPITDETGRIIGAVETLQDVSAQRNAETELQHSHASLEQEIVLRTAELAESNRQLAASLDKVEALNQLKRAFLHTISHELKTPLNGIIGMAELIRMDPSSSETAEYATIIHESGQRLFKHVSEILDLTEMEAGEARPIPGPYSTRELIESVIDRYSLAARNKQIDLSLTFADSTPEIVTTDGLRLGNSLSPLIENAVKYTHQGNVQVAVSADHDMLQIRISDTGPGIPEESRHTVFEKFRQTKSRGFRHDSGLGLGLALARAHARLLGGDLMLEAPNGNEGTCFTLRIPGNC